MPDRRSWRLIGAALALAAVAAVLIIALPGDDKPAPPAEPAPVVHVDGVDADTARDDTLRLTAAAQDYLGVVSSDTAGVGPHKDLGEGDRPEPFQAPLATQEFPGCRTQFVRNMSERSVPLSQVEFIVWHYTVSPDTPGWADNDALTAMANNPANGVSWTFSIGRHDGNCAYNVPLTMKPWTQAAANSRSVGIEVIATGSEDAYVEGAGKRRLFAVTRETGRRLGIPMRRGHWPDRPGIIQHADLGAAGGGHHDIGPFPFPGRLIAELKASANPVPATVIAQCRVVARYRRAHTGPANQWQRARLERVHAAGYGCSRNGKPVRRAA